VIVEVYFDDFKVRQVKSPVIEATDYYPFGLTFNKYSRENALPNKIKLFQGQEHIDDLSLNWDSFKWRNHQPEIGRFFNIDPLADSYVYNSPYAFAENKLGMGIELEGLELLPFPSLIFEGSPPIRPFVEPMMEHSLKLGEVGAKLGEVGAKLGEAGARTGKFSEEQLQNFSRGNKIEVEQLAKNGLEKNTKPIEVVDPKTGQTGRTTPDAFKNEGKSTSEIKNVKEQALTRQLRLQKSHSEGNGFKPELIINKEAKLTKPLQEAGFDIKLYQTVTSPSDATKVAPSPAQMKQKVSPCHPSTGCI
jgi:RHS repeat-associated protein